MNATTYPAAAVRQTPRLGTAVSIASGQLPLGCVLQVVRST
jgi:hypothetical protein